MTIGSRIYEVTKLSRKDKTISELKHNVISWFSPNVSNLIVIFPILAVLKYERQICDTSL